MASKKKITQLELRRLMNEQKKKCLSNGKRIESPLAKYNSSGALNCVICNTVIKSEAMWSVHLMSNKHKENIFNKVSLKKKERSPSPPPKASPSSTNQFKRPAPPPMIVPTKPVKSILKNAPPAPKYAKMSSGSARPTSDVTVESTEKEESSGPSSAMEEEEEEIEEVNGDAIPEGFFDDPKLDAKVRNVEFKDPIQEEWEQFQREIKEESTKAQQIIAEDQEEATTERQIDEIDEQLRHWSRVVDLEKKKKEVITVPESARMDVKEEASSGEEDFEEFGDWRAKQSFH